MTFSIKKINTLFILKTNGSVLLKFNTATQENSNKWQKQENLTQKENFMTYENF